MLEENALLGITRPLQAITYGTLGYHYKLVGINENITTQQKDWTDWNNSLPSDALDDGTWATYSTIGPYTGSGGCAVLIGFDNLPVVSGAAEPNYLLADIEVSAKGSNNEDVVYTTDILTGTIDDTIVHLATDVNLPYRIKPIATQGRVSRRFLYQMSGVERTYLYFRSETSYDFRIKIHNLCYLTNTVVLPSEENGNFSFSPMYSNKTSFTTLSGRTIHNTTAPALYSFDATYQWSDRGEKSVGLHNLFVDYVNGNGHLVWYPSANGITTAIPEYISLEDIPNVSRDENTVYSVTIGGHTQP